jgi:hypothetical protein
MFNNHLPFNHLRAFNYLRACKAPNKAGKAYNLRFEISNLKLLTPMSAESQRAKQQPTKEYVRNYEQIMQNKPNFPETQMSVNKVLTMNYEKKDTWWTGKKRTQTNPNKPNLFRGQK